MENRLELRAHHAVCIRFFKGRGYSQGFTNHMAGVIAGLEDDTPVRTVCHADVICAGCPNLNGGVCASEAKVRRYDERVLALCGLDQGAQLAWGELFGLVSQRILLPGRRKEVCSDCEWNEICSQAEAKR